MAFVDVAHRIAGVSSCTFTAWQRCPRLSSIEDTALIRTRPWCSCERRGARRSGIVPRVVGGLSLSTSCPQPEGTSVNYDNFIDKAINNCSVNNNIIKMQDVIFGANLSIINEASSSTVSCQITSK